MRFVFALIGGLVAAILAAIVWAAITAATSFQIGYMSIGVGFAVAFAVRFCGQSHDRRFAILSGALSLFGCLLGNYLAALAMAAQHLHASTETMILGSIRGLPMFFQVIGDTFNPMDLLFYAIGVYFGYKYALVPLRRPAPAGPQPEKTA
ncbi:MAG TPA: hypothetical protein VFO29_05605 [Candidatus Rubrimentiphilum sp.]|nr:hypothetical protein [Candidatus Rubrimentiphilum sp.]